MMDNHQLSQVAALSVGIEGNVLSRDDGAILVPKTADCGDPSANGWPSDWQQLIQKPKNVSVSNDSARFFFPMPSSRVANF